VMESPQYIGEVLGETWKAVKEHWPVLLATTVALVGAELLVGALAAAPEPTMITKFLAVGLQGLITAVAGAGVVLSGRAALIAGQQWLTAAWTAKGDAGKLKAASKAFLNMIGNVVMVVASAAGVKASAGKTGALTGLYTREQLTAQIGNKATYETLMDTLRSRGVTKNNAQLLGQLLKKVPDPLELKGWLRKVDKPAEFLDLLGRYPLNRVRMALSEIDGESIKPEFASRLLKLKLEHPIPTTPLRPEQSALLNTPGWTKQKPDSDLNLARNALRDALYQGRNPKKLTQATPAELRADQVEQAASQTLLDDILRGTTYVYRAVPRETLKFYVAAGKINRPSFMTNVLPESADEAAYLGQMEGRWYGKTEGLPEVVIRIPVRALVKQEVPRIAGNNASLLGHELTTSAYPTAGRGGALQFMGETDSFDMSWVLDLKVTNPGGRAR